MDKGPEKIIVKLACVVLAFSLWLYVSNVENPTRDYQIQNVPVEIENIDSLKESKLVVSSDQDFKVDLRVEGPTSQIYSLDKDDFKLKIDLSEYVLKKGENNIPIEVENYPEGINIKNTNNLTVKVKVEELAQKEVNVISNVVTTFKAGCSQKSLSVNPETVVVLGPSSLVDKVENAALIGDFNDIYEDIEESFQMSAVDKYGKVITGVQLSKSEGILQVKVAKGKEVSIIPSYTGSLRDGLVMESAELSLSKVTISGEIDKIDGIEVLSTEDINLSNINSSQDIETKIKIPDGVTIISGNDNLTVKIKIKNTQTITKDFYNLKINYSGFEETKFKYEMPSTLNLTLSAAAEELQNINLDNIKIDASVIGLAEGEHSVIWTAKLLNESNVKIVSNTGTITVKITKI